MSVQLHPDIEQLDRSSLCYSIYSQLYHNFFNAQQKKDAEHPYGVEEGDETSVRLKIQPTDLPLPLPVLLRAKAVSPAVVCL